MAKVTAITSMCVADADEPGAAVGGYPYYAVAHGPCSVHLNRGVEEEQG